MKNNKIHTKYLVGTAVLKDGLWTSLVSAIYDNLGNRLTPWGDAETDEFIRMHGFEFVRNNEGRKRITVIESEKV